MAEQNKKQNYKVLRNPVFWLIIGALIIQTANIIITLSLGTAQKDVCPKSDFPGGLSIFLGAGSLALIISVMYFAKNKILAFALLLFWIVLVFVVGYILQFVAVGGLDWCEFLGR